MTMTSPGDHMQPFSISEGGPIAYFSRIGPRNTEASLGVVADSLTLKESCTIGQMESRSPGVPHIRTGGPGHPDFLGPVWEQRFPADPQLSETAWTQGSIE